MLDMTLRKSKMRMLRSCLCFPALVLSLAACGGPPESRVALSEPGAAAYDARLPGNWYFANDRGAVYLQIAPRKEAATLEVIGIRVGYKDDDPVRWIRAIAHASELDGKTYYNVRRVAGAGDDYTAEGERLSFIILRTEFSEDGTLTLCFINNSIIKNFVKEGRGREAEGNYKGEKVPYQVLQMSRPELIALIREVTPEKLFRREEGSFHRLVPTVDKSN